MRYRIISAVAATALALVALSGLLHESSPLRTKAAGWTARTPWGDPDLQGEWTSEGEYGVPFERAAQYGTRQFLTDAEYAKRLEDVRIRDERDLQRVDVLSGKVDGPNAPIPHWREYNTTSAPDVAGDRSARRPSASARCAGAATASRPALRLTAGRRALRHVRRLWSWRPLHRARRRLS
jgi:hypothetical protein